MSRRAFLIAEIGQAHEGSLGIAHSYIDALGDTGIDAIKFQTHIAEAESSNFEEFRINFSLQDKTRYDYWKRMSFSTQEWIGLKEHCEKVGLEFISTPFSIAAVDLLENLNVKRYKIGSGDTDNYLLLDKVAQTKKPMILSSGMSSHTEIEETVGFLKKYGSDISILQCTTAYPTPADKIGLNVISELKNRFPNNKIGFSDHSGNIFSGLAAISHGAEILEFHVVFDKKSYGPDTTSSLTLDEIQELVRGVRFLEIVKYNPVDKSTAKEFTELKEIFGRSLAVNRDLPAGHIIQKTDLECKKPAGHGVSAKDFELIVGKKLVHPMKKYEFLSENDLDND